MSHARPRTAHPDLAWDPLLLVLIAVLAGLGLVMVYSASIALVPGRPGFYLERQALFMVLAAGAAWLTSRVPLAWVERSGPWALGLAFALLGLVLVPGVGREVNGAVRWLPLGPFAFQVSELVKLLLVVFLAGYLVRRGDEVRTRASGFLKPMAVLAILCGLLLAQPDFGAAVVVMATALGMMYLAGVQFWKFGLLLLLTAAAMVAVAVASPYRWARIVSFTDPWADPFDSGFQLTQALIAFGRGEWFGVGLGGSIQKLSYLPEPHTDFLFAVLAEELGLAGAVAVIALFLALGWRILALSARAAGRQRPYAAHLSAGIGLWLTLQGLVSLGVNMGVLPTKGLTLPFMSYGGSSLLVGGVAVGLLLRVVRECNGRDAR